jgi:hypothetical protein
MGHRTKGISRQLHEPDFDMLMKLTQNRSKKHVQNGPCACKNRQVSGPFGYNLPSKAIKECNYATQKSVPKRGYDHRNKGYAHVFEAYERRNSKLIFAFIELFHLGKEGLEMSYFIAVLLFR